MAKLSSEQRGKLKTSTFGEPKERKYPMPDKSHAANAKARASEMEHKGKISKGEEEKIDRKADQVLGKKGGARSGGHHNVVNPHSHQEKMRHC